jgi:exodeoxyribonuclease V alpha subunit
MKNPDAMNEQPAERLAEGFARHVERWAIALQHEAAALHTVRHAAYHASLATSTGHVCTTLDHLADTVAPSQGMAEWRQALLASPLVGTPEQLGSKPLVLDEEGRLYLHRYFDYEQRLASRLMRAARLPAREIGASLKDRLATLFLPLAGDTDVDWQKIAAALALRQGLTIISGGPGTGKTTTVVNLLACLIEQNADCRIALAAPTGKAAARMTEAIRQRSQHLPKALREKLPTESFTVHRLLRFNPGSGRFVHDARNPLAIDVLIVDEASMLDLALATKLLEAVPATARIILLGDKDQLAAVESGAVFAELCADPSITPPCRADLAEACGLSAERIAPPAPARPSALHDAAVWLTRNYRFAADSAIGRLAADVNAGRAEEAVTWLRQHADGSVDWQEPSAGESSSTGMAAVLEGYAAYFDAVRRNPTDVQSVTQAFDAFRVLCAVRDGPQGVEAVNDAVTRHAGRLLHDVGADYPQ